jgi:geranylgeranyl reductase family protein
MDACDVLIVGAGPAGSACAWALRESGLDVLIVDKSRFPRDKICGGWITPAVVAELDFDLTEYARGRVLQPITGFRTSMIGSRDVETAYAEPISYGIRRCEFDEFLFRRAGARSIENTAMKSLERRGDEWIFNGAIKTRLIIGAGGHFCPVARFFGAGARKEEAVAAQEIEFEMTAQEAAACHIRPETPELFFCADMKGYGWCFRKGNFLNIGLGRLDPRGLPSHVANFVAFLQAERKIEFEFRASLPGHAYLLYENSARRIVGDGMMLVGDSAGLAYSQSGEGIRPAIESGLLAAETIAGAEGDYGREKLETYRRALTSRFGKAKSDWAAAIGRRLPSGAIQFVARQMLSTKWFSRRVLLDSWFLHRHEPPLVSTRARRSVRKPRTRVTPGSVASESSTPPSVTVGH